MSIKPLFKKMAGLLKSPWVLALFVTLALVVFIWFIGPYIGFGDKKIFQSVVARLIATLALVFLWGLFVAIYYSKKRKAELADPEKAAERDKIKLESQNFREENKKIRARVRAAIKTVTSSNFYGPKGRSRYALPWYLVIGTENSGKTSLLFNSGLQFPINEQADRHLYDLKATESCEFLYSNHAVFVDTPGRYTEAHEEHERHKHWITFLRAIFRARKAKPLNGIIVCLSMRDIISPDGARREHIAKTLRKRLSEVLKRLHAYVPVYLVFTKCDAVPGFAEFFAHLSRSEREQIFGCPAEGNVMGSDMVRPELSELMHTLNAQIISKVHQERDISARGETFRFPQELAALGPRMEDFVHEAFGPSRYHKPVMLRGFFFTSALSVKDVLASSAAEGELTFQKGFQSSLGDYAKGFFLLRLLQDLIIPEARLAVAERSRRIGMLLRRYVPQLAAVGAFLFAVSFLGISFVNNYNAVDQVSLAYRDFKSARAMLPAIINSKQALPELDNLAKAVAVYNPEEDSSFSYGLGLYQGIAVRKAAADAYLEDLNERLLPFVRLDAAKRLASSSGNMRELKQALRAYLMLFQPERINPDFLLGWLQAMWSEQYMADAETQHKLYRHMDFLLRNGLKGGEADTALVAKARESLLKTPLAQLAYQHLQEEAAESGNVPYTFRLAFAGTASPFSGDSYQVPYMYTKHGFNKFFVLRSQGIIQSMADDSWIYGEKMTTLSDTDVQKLHIDVRNMYFRDYARHWSSALASLKVTPPTSLPEASKRCEQFISGASPVATILQELRNNIYLEVDFKSLGLDFLSTPADSSMPRPAPPAGVDLMRVTLLTGLNDEAGKLRQSFAAIDALLDENGQPKPLLQSAQDETAKIADYLLRLSVSDNRIEKVFNALVDVIQERDSALREAEIAAGRLPQPVAGWYLTAVSDGLFEMMRLSARRINDAYTQNVYPVYAAELRSFYPLNQKAERDANLDVFEQFFSPSGTLGEFHNVYLKHFVDARGSLKSVMGRQLPLSQAALGNVSKAFRIQNAFFNPKGELNVSLLMEPVVMDANLKRIDISHGDAVLSYWHGPVQGTSFYWPLADNATTVAAVQVTTMQGYVSHQSAKGDWALFRVLQQGKIKNSQGSNFMLEVWQNDKSAQFRSHIRNKDNPLNSGIFSFSLPETLYQH